MYLDLEIPLKNLGIQVLQTLDPPVPWTLPFFIESVWLAEVSFGLSDYCQWGHCCFLERWWWNSCLRPKLTFLQIIFCYKSVIFRWFHFFLVFPSVVWFHHIEMVWNPQRFLDFVIFNENNYFVTKIGFLDDTLFLFVVPSVFWFHCIKMVSTLTGSFSMLLSFELKKWLLQNKKKKKGKKRKKIDGILFLYVVPSVVLVPSHWNVQCQHPHRLLFHDFVIQIKNDYMIKKKKEKKNIF